LYRALADRPVRLHSLLLDETVSSMIS
jgi:hypothetical protein